MQVYYYSDLRSKWTVRLEKLTHSCGQSEHKEVSEQFRAGPSKQSAVGCGYSICLATCAAHIDHKKDVCSLSEDLKVRRDRHEKSLEDKHVFKEGENVTLVWLCEEMTN